MRKIIMARIETLCCNFLYYDRKNDSELSYKQLKQAVTKGHVTVDEMVAEFRKHLENTLK